MQHCTAGELRSLNMLIQDFQWRADVPPMNVQQDATVAHLLERIHTADVNPCYTAVLGGAGTGKSFIISRLLFELRRVSNTNVLIWATTGAASVPFEGATTIHQGCGIDIQLKLQRLQSGTELWRSLERGKVLIIEEISMAATALMVTVREACQRVRGNTLPFGGLTVVLFGDFSQLEAVGAQETRRGSSSSSSKLPEES